MQSARLFSGKTLRSARDLHPLQPDPDGSRANKNDFVALRFQAHDGLDHARERRQEGLVGRFMDDRRCPLRKRNAKSETFVQLLPFSDEGKWFTELYDDCARRSAISR